MLPPAGPHLVERLRVSPARSGSRVHAHKGHGRARAGVGGSGPHGVALGTHKMGSAPGGVHVGGIPLHGLEHGLVFLAGLDAGHAERDDLNAAEVLPLGGEHFVEGVSHFHGMAGQSR